MNALFDRVLKAYRPLYLHGLLMDGRYPHPSASTTNDYPDSRPLPRRRMLLVALTALRHRMPASRDRS